MRSILKINRSTALQNTPMHLLFLLVGAVCRPKNEC